MRIREDCVTRATPEKAWELIADPSLHSLWNPRIVGTEISSGDAPQLGFRYRVTYELNGRRNQFDAEITGFDAPARFVARLEERVKGDGKNWQRYMEESYTLTRRGDRTHVRHEARIFNSGVNVFLRLLIWLIQRTGKPVGQTFMDKFRELAEDENPLPGSRAG